VKWHRTSTGYLYRIASEAVGNAIKHADPDAITIRLAVDGDQLELTVRDDGVDIPADTEPTDGLGLHMMEYRAELIGARLHIEPAEEGGTIVRCHLPLQRAMYDECTIAAPPCLSRQRRRTCRFISL
jgi:signal transduction histidine kinase